MYVIYHSQRVLIMINFKGLYYEYSKYTFIM